MSSNCPECNKTLSNIYARKKNKVKRIEKVFYCENCKEFYNIKLSIKFAK